MFGIGEARHFKFCVLIDTEIIASTIDCPESDVFDVT